MPKWWPDPFSKTSERISWTLGVFNLAICVAAVQDGYALSAAASGIVAAMLIADAIDTIKMRPIIKLLRAMKSTDEELD